MARSQRGKGSDLYHHGKDFRDDRSGLKWSMRMKIITTWRSELVKRFQIEMVDTGLFSCRDKKGSDSVFVCCPRPKADAAQEVERDLLNFPVSVA